MGVNSFTDEEKRLANNLFVPNNNQNALFSDEDMRLANNLFSNNSEINEETKGNGFFGWAKDGFDAGFAGVPAGQVNFLDANLGLGKDTASYLDNVVKRNSKTKNVKVELTNPEYYKDPQGATYDLFNAAGSMTSLGLETLAMLLGGEAVGGVGVAANVLSKIPGGARAVEAGKALWDTTAGKFAVGNVVSKVPESISNAGNIVEEMRAEGKSEEEIRTAVNKDAGMNMLLNIPMGALESTGLMKLGKGGNALNRVLGGAAGGAGTNYIEEGAQAAIDDIAQGKPIDWDEVNNNAKVGLLTGGTLGGMVGGMKGADSTPTNLNAQQAEAWGEAQWVSEQTGVPAEFVYRQWAHESGNFTSQLARENNNFGGLTQVESNGEENKQPDGGNYYKQYGNMHEYAQDYINSFLRHYDGVGNVKSIEEFAQVLKDNGYYGDSVENYINGLKGIKTPTGNGIKDYANNPSTSEVDFDSGAAQQEKELLNQLVNEKIEIAAQNKNMDEWSFLTDNQYDTDAILKKYPDIAEKLANQKEPINSPSENNISAEQPKVNESDVVDKAIAYYERTNNPAEKMLLEMLVNNNNTAGLKLAFPFLSENAPKVPLFTPPKTHTFVAPGKKAAISSLSNVLNNITTQKYDAMAAKQEGVRNVIHVLGDLKEQKGQQLANEIADVREQVPMQRQTVVDMLNKIKEQKGQPLADEIANAREQTPVQRQSLVDVLNKIKNDKQVQNTALGLSRIDTDSLMRVAENVADMPMTNQIKQIVGKELATRGVLPPAVAEGVNFDRGMLDIARKKKSQYTPTDMQSQQRLNQLTGDKSSNIIIPEKGDSISDAMQWPYSPSTPTPRKSGVLKTAQEKVDENAFRSAVNRGDFGKAIEIAEQTGNVGMANILRNRAKFSFDNRHERDRERMRAAEKAVKDYMPEGYQGTASGVLEGMTDIEIQSVKDYVQGNLNSGKSLEYIEKNLKTIYNRTKANKSDGINEKKKIAFLRFLKGALAYVGETRRSNSGGISRDFRSNNESTKQRGYGQSVQRNDRVGYDGRRLQGTNNQINQDQHSEKQGAFSMPEITATKDGVKFSLAYHGSPHQFGKFDLGAIGTGEGNQVHGWGLYFSADKKVAENYRDKLSRKNPSEKQLYAVDIPKDAVMLNEDNPLNEQPQAVKQAIYEYMKQNEDSYITPNSIDDLGNQAGKQFYKEVVFNMKRAGESNPKKAASEKLNQLGIKGIIYDGYQDGRCYVVFDDKAIDIIAKYSKRDLSQKSSTPDSKNNSSDYKESLTDSRQPTDEEIVQMVKASTGQTIQMVPNGVQVTPKLQRIANFGERMGCPVRYFDGVSNLRGFHATGVTYINRRSQIPHNWVFWHESFHWMRNNNEKLYQDIVNYLKNTDAFSKEKIDAYREELGRPELSDMEVMEEMLADAMPEVSKRVGLMKQLAKDNPSLAEKIVAWIRDTMDRFHEFFTTPEHGLSPRDKKAMVEAFTNLARDMVDGSGNRIFLLEPGRKLILVRNHQPASTALENPTPAFSAQEINSSLSKRELKKFIENAIKDNAYSKLKIDLGAVSEAEARQIQKVIGIDVQGYHHILGGNDVRHIQNRHGTGNEKNQDQQALTPDDMIKAFEAIKSPEQITKGTPTQSGAPSIRFIKSDSNGQYTVVEVVREKNKQLAIKTIWKKITAKRHTGNADPQYTSKTDSSLSSSNINHSISQNNADIQEDTQKPWQEGVRKETLDKIVEVTNELNDYLAKHGETIDINTPERQALRRKIAEELYGTGAKNKNREIHLVLGPPAAGKSSVADPLAERTGSMIIDSDMAKERLPEFNNGKFAGAVHRESDMIMQQVLEQATLEGDNIILPVVGKTYSGLVKKVTQFKANGYKVHIVHVDLPIEKAIQRAIVRFEETGRFVNPNYVASVGYSTRENYDKIKNIEGVDSYEAYSNDVARGMPSIRLENVGEIREGRRRALYGNDGESQAEKGTKTEEPKLNHSDKQGGFSVPENKPKFSYKSNAEHQSFVKRLMQPFKSSKGQELNRKAVKNALEELLDMKIRAGHMDGDISSILNETRGIIRSRNSFDWENILPHVGSVVAKRLKLNNTDKASENYIARWLMDGALSEESSQVAQDFKKAMQKEPEFADKLTEIRNMFDDMRSRSGDMQIQSTISNDKETPLVDTLKEYRQKIYDEFIEEFGPIKRMVEQIEKKIGKPLSFGTNPYLAFRMWRGRFGKAIALIEGNHDGAIRALQTYFPSVNFDNFKTINMILKHIGANRDKEVLKKFGTYCLAKHARDIHAHNQKGEEQIVTPPEWSLENCEYTIKKYEQENPAFVQAQKDLVNFSNITMQIMRESGLLSNEQYYERTRKWKNYVPLFREFEDNENISFGDSTKRLHGSTKNIINPIESIIHNTYKFVDMAEKNKAKNTLRMLCQINDTGEFLNEVESNNPNDKTCFSVMVDGKKKWFETDPAIVAAVNNMRPEQTNLFWKIISYPVKLLRAGSTFMSPEFVLRNPFRDYADALIYSKHGFIKPTDLLHGFVSAIKADDLYWEFQVNGGAQAAAVSVDRNYTQFTMDKMMQKHSKDDLLKPWKWLDYIQAVSEFSEYATRLSYFKKTQEGLAKINPAINKSLCLQEAAFEARDLMDFARGGKSSRKWNQWAIFANASLQGWDKTFRTFNFKDPKNRKQALAAMARIGMYTLLPTLAFWFWNRDDDRYKNLPHWVKDTHYTFSVGDKTFRIPKGQDAMNIILSGELERFLNYAYTKDPKALDKKLEPIKQMLPGLAPTMVMPIAEAIANYSFFKEGSIVPQYQQKLTPKMQSGPYTTSISKWLGEKLDIAPRKLDHLLFGYTGSLGRLATGAYDTVSGEKQLNLSVEELPFVRGLTISPYKHSKYVNEYYEERSKQEALYNELKATGKRPDGFDSKMYARLKSIAKPMQHLSKLERTLMNNEEMLVDVKKQKQDEIQQRRIKLVRKAMGVQ